MGPMGQEKVKWRRERERDLPLFTLSLKAEFKKVKIFASVVGFQRQEENQTHLLTDGTIYQLSCLNIFQLVFFSLRALKIYSCTLAFLSVCVCVKVSELYCDNGSGAFQLCEVEQRFTSVFMAIWYDIAILRSEVWRVKAEARGEEALEQAEQTCC